MIRNLSKLNPNLLHQIASLCQDHFFNDFDKVDYELGLYRGLRKAAIQYQVLNRLYEQTFKIVAPVGVNEDEYVTEEKKKEIQLNIPGFMGEYQVMINDKEYKSAKIKGLTEDYTYYIVFGHNDYLINYTPRTKEDKFAMFYTTNIDFADYEMENISPVLPTKYEDQVIKYTIQWMAVQGLAKFKAEKREKWIGLGRVFGLEELKKSEPKLAEKYKLNIKPWVYP